MVLRNLATLITNHFMSTDDECIIVNQNTALLYLINGYMLHCEHSVVHSKINCTTASARVTAANMNWQAYLTLPVYGLQECRLRYLRRYRIAYVFRSS